MSSTRQLAAILFADIAGYTALMGRDETRALDVIRQFKEIAQPLVDQHRGRWHKDLGDGALCSFQSSADAVQCAMAIQQQINTQENFIVRIGIHLGDVTFQDGDIFGDGVNIASRIQSVAADGGICISEQVFRSTRNKVGIDAQYLGSRKFKGLTSPVKLYQIKSPHIAFVRAKKAMKIPWYVAVAAAILAALGTWMIIWPGSGKITDTTSWHFQVVLPEDQVFLSRDAGNHFAISPDGTKLVYRADSAVYLRSLLNNSTVRLNADQGVNPCFSPDGEFIAFGRPQAVSKVRPGGLSTKLCETPNSEISFWTGDNRLFFTDGAGTCYWVSANGGVAQSVASKVMIINPSPLPGLAQIVACDLDYNLFVVTLETGEIQPLQMKGWSPRYVDPGYLVFAREGQLFAARFDPKTVKVTSEAVSVVNDLHTASYGTQHIAHYDISDNGTLVYHSHPPGDISRFVWRDLAGEIDTLPIEPASYGMFSLSPDGTRIAAGLQSIESQVWIYDLNSGIKTRLDASGVTAYPVWSRDGRWLTYSGYEQGGWEIYRKRANGSGARERLTNSKGYLKIPGAWTPNDSSLVYYEYVQNRNAGVFMLSLGDTTISEPVHNTPKYEGIPDISPDGEYLSYYSSISGDMSTYVVPLPETGEVWQVSNQGFDARWARDGKKLFYRSIDNTFYAVDVDTRGGFQKSSPQVLFTDEYIDVLSFSFDIHPNGDKLLLLQPIHNDPAPVLEVKLNWVQTLEKLL